MERYTLCSRCADKIRNRKIVHLVKRPINVQKLCDNCGRRSWIAFYDVEDMRKPQKEE